jgi:hypothetical protein
LVVPTDRINTDLAFFTPEGRLIAITSAIPKTLSLVKVTFYQTFEEDPKFYAIFNNIDKAVEAIQNYFEEF